MALSPSSRHQINSKPKEKFKKAFLPVPLKAQYVKKKPATEDFLKLILS